MTGDRRPWGVLLLVLFMAASLAYRASQQPTPWVEQSRAARPPGLMPLAPAQAGFRALLDGDAIDINHASDAALQQLPGIGPSLASRLRAERERAPFRDLQDLQRVRGLGPRSVAKLAPFVRFAPPKLGTLP